MKFFSKYYFVLVASVLFMNNIWGQSSELTRMLTQPAISNNHIAFIYAEDLWVCNVDGSNPIRLTIDEGIESNPVFSPDGKTIAFSAQYDGNTDVYSISTMGGIPKRLTMALQ